MAVLVQVMVEADSSGVAFTANPLTGRRDEVVLTAVRGLGERLVSGEAVGDEWLVRGADASLRRESEGTLTAEKALAVAALVSVRELCGGARLLAQVGQLDQERVGDLPDVHRRQVGVADAEDPRCRQEGRTPESPARRRTLPLRWARAHAGRRGP